MQEFDVGFKFLILFSSLSSMACLQNHRGGAAFLATCLGVEVAVFAQTSFSEFAGWLIPLSYGLLAIPLFVLTGDFVVGAVRSSIRAKLEADEQFARQLIGLDLSARTCRVKNHG